MFTFLKNYIGSLLFCMNMESNWFQIVHNELCTLENPNINA